MGKRIRWQPVLEKAKEILHSHEGVLSLRGLFYQLVAAVILPNTTSAYKRLSSRTAQARRDGWFPDLIDQTRSIHRFAFWDGPEEALEAITEQYRRDRTEGQPWLIYLGVEKRGLVPQLEKWFGDLGLPVLELAGYASQTYVDEVARLVRKDGRPSVLLYGGDFDPSGEDIERDFVARTDCFDKVHRVALTWEQVVGYDLPPQLGKSTDSRAADFQRRHGQLVQVEIDALPPAVLRGLFREALDGYWDESIYDEVLEVEEAERAQLAAITL